MTGRNKPSSPPSRSLSFSADGKRLGTGGKEPRIWDLSTGKLLARFTGHKSPVRCSALSPDGKSLVLAGQNQQVRWCDPRTGEVQRSSRWKPDSHPRCIGFHAGKTLVAGYNGESLHLAEMDPGARVYPLRGHKGFLQVLAFSADGRTLASASGREAFLWDAATGRRKGKAEKTDETGWANYALALSPGGNLLAAAAEVRVPIWDLEKGKLLIVLSGHPHRVSALAFSPDGRWLASGCGDHVVRLWETATWKLAGTFKGHAARMVGLAFSPDGRVLASGSDDTSILLWDLTGSARGPAGPLSAQRLDDLWAELGEDPPRARRALWALARSPRESVPHLSVRLGAKKVDAKRIDRLIVELDDDDFDVRVGAMRQLQSLGCTAAPAMRKALKTTDSAEVKLRLLRCLGPLDSEQGRLRRLRGMAALEYAGTAQARAALEVLRRE